MTPSLALLGRCTPPGVMSERPLLSVIIPRYTPGAYVADGIRSVLAQTMPEWECIIVNHGSTDDTRGVSRVCRDDREEALGAVARHLVRAFRRDVPWPVQRLTHRVCDVALETFGVDLPL